MGKVRRLLFSKQLDSDAPRYYADKRAIETAESLHVHERNVRVEYTEEEFMGLSYAMREASAVLGYAATPDTSPDAPTTYLDVSDLTPAPGVTPSRFDIEESEYPTMDETTIHVHYRNLRLEFSHLEFAEFALGVYKAWEAWHESRMDGKCGSP